MYNIFTPKQFQQQEKGGGRAEEERSELLILKQVQITFREIDFDTCNNNYYRITSRYFSKIKNDKISKSKNKNKNIFTKALTRNFH